MPADVGPYEVVGDLRVPQCSTLVIEAGCYFDFQEYYTFIVDTSATLQAIGNVSDSIIFTASDTATGWYGLRFFSAADNCGLAYCRIEWGNIPFEDPQEPFADGAGVSVSNSNIALSNCVFSNNTTVAGVGGGIYTIDSDIHINECLLQNNWAGFGGGGIWCESSTAEIIGNKIIDNIAHYVLGGEYGAGIAVEYGEAIINDNFIVGNYSYRIGGGLYLSRASIMLHNNMIIYNRAWDGGAGLSAGDCPNMVARNNIIAFNECVFPNQYLRGGGAAIGRSDSLRFENNTIFGNIAAKGGGIYSGNDSSIFLLNNIIWGNISQMDTAQIYTTDSLLTVQYCCIQDGWPGEGNIDLDPLFVDPEGGDFHLRWDNFPIEDETKSPCIDAGSPWSPLDPDSTRADIGALSFDQHVGIDDEPPALPREIRLLQNYPNPFNSRTTIQYAMPEAGPVKIEVYDLLGRRVGAPVDEFKPAGYHRFVWDAGDLATGVYFYKIQAGDYTETKKIVLVK